MARQPVQSPITRVLQSQAAAVAGSRLYLTQSVSARMAQGEFAVAQARKAAERALAAAAAAQAAADAALQAAQAAKEAAGRATAAAAAAQAAAEAASGAASSALNAANSALSEAARFAVIGLWPANPVTVGASASTAGWAVIPEMSLTGDWGDHSLIVRFSMEIAPSVGADPATGGEIVLRFNGQMQEFTHRAMNGTGATGFTYTFNPHGSGVIDVVWRGAIRNLERRRQLFVQRLP